MESKVILEVTSADIPGMLDALTRGDITVLEVIYTDLLTVRFQVSEQELRRAQSIIEARGESCKERRRIGLYWKIRGMFQHWVLIMGLTLLLLLTIFLPTRIMFIEVRGNQSIPSRMILEKAESCGIRFGGDRGAVRSEQMKNTLLDDIPQLQWAGVNTEGCVALITVQERQIPERTEDIIPGNIVAICDGILLEMTADRGTAVAKPGQAVRAGDILISGYTDCGGVILFSGAKGEVYGCTRHEISGITMGNQLKRGKQTEEIKKISLIFGKNHINFYEDSGILDTGCVKMYSEYYITLPGGWKLPIKLRVQRSVHYEMTEENLDAEEAEKLLDHCAAEYLLTQMIAGRILSVRSAAENYRYQAEYVCREMIGRVIHEEIVAEYGEDH